MGLNMVKHITMVALLSVLAMGCSKKIQSADPADANTNTDTSGENQNPAPASGAVADLQIVSHAVLEEYAGRRINAVTDIKIWIDTFDVTEGSNQYGGVLKISYRENGNLVTGTFDSGTSTYDTRYNKWVTTGGTQKLKLMFQDNLGAIVVEIDNQTNDLGLWKGDVYFRNFDFGVCANPPYYGSPVCNVQSGQKCWNITAGPYDCRSFMSGNTMSPSTVDLPGYGSTYSHQGVTYPRKGYQKLGSFYNLNVQAAINAN